MASSKSRQRELARAKFHRQAARRAVAERRRRQVWASVAGGLAVLLIIGFTSWQLGVFERDKKSTPPAASGPCTWNPRAAEGDVKDSGTPPNSDIPTSGTRPFIITFAGGTVEASLDLAKAPCTAASMAFLAAKNFFNNTKCHRLLNSGSYVLQCGDPSGTGRGGPNYTFADENLPVPTPPAGGASPSAPAPASYTYPRGTLAMANSGPATNGSQFFIVFKDSPFPPNYTIFGQVTKGLDVIEKIAAAGTVDNGQGEPSKPKQDVIVQSLTVGELVATPPAPAPSVPPTSPPPAASPTPSVPSSGRS